MVAPQGYKIGPAGARKRRKASVKKRRNTSPGFNTLDFDKNLFFFCVRILDYVK